MASSLQYAAKPASVVVASSAPWPCCHSSRALSSSEPGRRGAVSPTNISNDWGKGSLVMILMSSEESTVAEPVKISWTRSTNDGSPGQATNDGSPGQATNDGSHGQATNDGSPGQGN